MQDVRERYESELARGLRVRHVVSLAYARHGLAGILSTLKIQPGDAVLLPALTCKIVPLSLLSLDIRPNYADISTKTLNLDAGRALERLTPGTKAVLFQHTYGQAQGITDVASFARERGLALIEDCAQCLPYSVPEQVKTPLGLAAMFSNNLRKPMPAGSGGFVATDDDDLADALREYRDRMPPRSVPSRLAHRLESLLHAHLLGPRTYWPLFELHGLATGRYRTQALRAEILNEMQATRYQVSEDQYVSGLTWLKRLDALATHRCWCCRRYREALGGLANIDLPRNGDEEPLYFFPVLVRDKPALLRKARARSIEIVGWPQSTPIYPVRDPSALGIYGYQQGSCPAAEEVSQRLVGLPTDLATRPRHVEAVIRLVRQHHQAG